MATSSNPGSALKLNEISVSFQSGISAFKWSEDTKKVPTPTNVHLSIDSKGFYLLCRDKNTSKVECFDIALIHDTRADSLVSLPPGAEDCDILKTGIPDVNLVLKWLRIDYGDTFVPLADFRTIHFACDSPTIAQKWAEQLFQHGHNQRVRNLSNSECLEKIHAKIINSLIDFDKQTLAVRSLIEFLCTNSRNNAKKEKICRALEFVSLPYKTDSVIRVQQFTFDVFFRFYMHLMERREINTLFNSIDGRYQGYLSRENIMKFLRKQNDGGPDPFGTNDYEQKAVDLITKYTQHDQIFRDRGICEKAFLQYLLSFDNYIVDPTSLDLFMNMDKPLAHYFISSSHNTYLTASQLNGRASVEMYRQVLLTGCRCIELDVVDSEVENDGPEIRHIFTPVKPVLFADVLVTIRDYAFKVTPYPLILSIENHCRAKGQARMAKYFTEILGNKLLSEPLKSHPCEKCCSLPSPNDLKYKILIKNKKLDTHSTSKANTQSTGITRSSSDPSITSAPATQSLHVRASSNNLLQCPDAMNSNPRHDIPSKNENSSDDDEGHDNSLVNAIDPTRICSSNSDALPESKATKEISDLVHYTVAVRFKNFAYAQALNRSYELSSFPEDRALHLIRVNAKDFLAYNQRQISRIYPRGTRVASSNFNPYVYWRVGCQMVALNYQKLDIPVQLNLGLFSFNKACGYIEKPSVLCESRNSFDPRVARDIENVVGYEIGIKVISGQFLCQNREPSFVDIQMYGMYGDTNKRHEYHIRAKQWNGFQAIYDDTNNHSNEFTIRFPKVILPEMAALRFAVLAEDGTFVGQSFIPIAHLRPGYRHVVLRNQINIPVQASSLFIFIEKKISINAKDQEFVNRLDNPFLHQHHRSNNGKTCLHKSSSDVTEPYHNSLLNELGDSVRRRNLSISLDKTIWYQKDAIAGSEFNEKKRLSKVVGLDDIRTKELVKRNEDIHTRLRRISADYKKKIQKERDNMEKYLDMRNDETTSHHATRSKSTNGTINKKDIEQSEQYLLKLYEEKFAQQEYIQCKLIKEYYEKLEKKIKADYTKKLKQILTNLEKEKSRVEDSARFQTKKEKSDIEKTETDRDRRTILKNETLDINTIFAASTIHTLEEMCEQVQKLLQLNLEANLNELDRQRCREMEECHEDYFNQYNNLEIALQRQVHRDDYGIPSVSSSPMYPSTMASASLPNVCYSSSEMITPRQETNR